jgi:hypothetical protein
MRLGIAGLAVSGLASCLALAACGGGSQPAPHATAQLFGAGTQQDWPPDRSLAGVHACKLIPAATIAQTLGQLEEPPAESADGLTCFYNTQISSAEGGPSFILSIIERSAYEAAKTISDSEAQAHLLRLASVTGIGDEGFATSVSTGGPSYVVRVARGGAGAEILVNSVTSANERQAERLVALALARI